MAAKQTSAVRQRIALAESDFEALEWFQEKYRSGGLVNGIRLSLTRQLDRDSSKHSWRPPASWDAREAKIKASVKGMLKKAKTYGSDECRLRDWSCWLYPEDLVAIDKIMQKYGFTHKIEALRFAVRCQAAAEGFRPSDGEW